MDTSSVRAYGPGLEPNNCRANIPQRFKIDATKSGKAPVGVDVRTDGGRPLAHKPQLVDNKDGTYDVTYVPPPENSECNINVTYAGKDIPNRCNSYMMRFGCLTYLKLLSGVFYSINIICFRPYLYTPRGRKWKRNVPVNDSSFLPGFDLSNFIPLKNWIFE